MAGVKSGDISAISQLYFITRLNSASSPSTITKPNNTKRDIHTKVSSSIPLNFFGKNKFLMWHFYVAKQQLSINTINVNTNTIGVEI